MRLKSVDLREMSQQKSPKYSLIEPFAWLHGHGLLVYLSIYSDQDFNQMLLTYLLYLNYFLVLYKKIMKVTLHLLLQLSFVSISLYIYTYLYFSAFHTNRDTASTPFCFMVTTTTREQSDCSSSDSLCRTCLWVLASLDTAWWLSLERTQDTHMQAIRCTGHVCMYVYWLFFIFLSIWFSFQDGT